MSDKFKGIFDGFKGMDFSMPKLDLPSLQIPLMEMPEIINPAHATNELLEESLGLAKEQIQLLADSLKQASSNYNILKEHYDLQVEINKDNGKELKKSKRFNGWSLAIAIVPLVLAIVIGILALS